MLKRRFDLNISGVFPFLYYSILLVSGLYAIPGLAIPVSSTVEWQPCHQEAGPFECARFDVPLVHDAAPGEESPGVSIAMVRLPAADPERRIGTLFFNPGGPGVSGVDFLLRNGPQLYTDDVRARYDLVGFDPRGIARSDALTCLGTPDLLSGILAELGYIRKDFPGSLEEIVARWMYDLSLVTNCNERGGAIIDYMTTADVARDLDLLRQAVGDEQLNFAGYSYGSYLGVTYANLFPDKVGALVVDGVIDPIAWATGRDGEHVTTPVSTRLRSDAGAMATLGEFFRLCDEGNNCAFAGDSAARFAALAESLRTRPLVATLANGRNLELEYELLIVVTRGVLNAPQLWRVFAQFLAAVEAQAPPADIGNILSQFLPPSEGGLNQEAFHGVMCSDSDNPREFWAWPVAAASKASDVPRGAVGSSTQVASRPRNSGCDFSKVAAKARGAKGVRKGFQKCFQKDCRIRPLLTRSSNQRGMAGRSRNRSNTKRTSTMATQVASTRPKPCKACRRRARRWSCRRAGILAVVVIAQKWGDSREVLAEPSTL